MSISCSNVSPDAIVSNIKTAAGKGAPIPTRPQPSRDKAPVTTANGLVHYSERYRVFSASDSVMAGLDTGMVLVAHAVNSVMHIWLAQPPPECFWRPCMVLDRNAGIEYVDTMIYTIEKL